MEPLVGPAPGLRNMWLAEGFPLGLRLLGGRGISLAQMRVEGGPRSTCSNWIPKR